MASDHPFQTLFETLGRLPVAHSDKVNRRASEVLHDILSVPVEHPGRCILLRAPRAGHGKTHLLSRIQHQLGASHEFIPLHAAFGCQIDASTVIDDTLRRLLRPLPAASGLCALDLVTRSLFSVALQPLVISGEVPCQDREAALTALRSRPIETFDFHHPHAVTAHWARENFEILGQRLSMELARHCGLPLREVAFWVEHLFRFAATPAENTARLRAPGDAVHAGNPAASVLVERLEALLAMLTLLTRVVLVADELEGFSTDESAALRLAAFLGTLRQSVERLDVILSLNRDVWDNAFVPKLSGGLADRLSEVVVELEALNDVEMAALLDSRVPGMGTRILSRIDRQNAGSHARGVIRAAADVWKHVTEREPQPVPVGKPAPTTTPETAPVSPPRSTPPVPPAADFVAAAPAEAMRDPAAAHPEESFAAPATEPVPQPATSPPPIPPAELEPPVEPPATPPPDPDRVDDLLRQFRERYGRSGV